MRRLEATLLATLTALVALSCLVLDPNRERSVDPNRERSIDPTEERSVDPHEERIWLDDLTWMDDGWVYAIRYQTGLVRLKAGMEPEEVALAPEGCLSLEPSINSLARVSPNVLAFATPSCWDVVGSSTIYTYDVSTGSIEDVTHLLWPVEDMAWMPGTGVGFVTLGSWCDGALLMVVDGGLHPVLVPAPPAPEWRLARSEMCTDGVEASSPFVSGSSVFLAAPARGRAPEPAVIARMEIPEGPVTVVADDFTAVFDLAVSPDGSLLVVSGRRGGTASCWVVDLISGQVVDLDVPSARDLSLSPSGKQVVIWNTDTVVFRDL